MPPPPPLSDREEQQAKQREEEDEHWNKAMSGELSGPRKAALATAESVSEVQRISDQLQDVERDEDMYTAMYKSKHVLHSPN